MTRRDIRDRIFKIVFTLEFNDAEGMQDQLDFAFDPEMPGDEEDDPLLYGIVSNEDRDYITTKVKNIISKKAEIDEIISQISEGWKLPRIGKEELAILRLGVYEVKYDESIPEKVAINEAVELAKKYNVELEVLSSLNPIPGTVVKEVTKDMEGMLIKGVAKDTDVAVITILNVPDEPGMSFRIFGLLAQKNINVDIILQSTGRDGKKDISFTCSEGEAELAMRVLKESAHFSDVSVDTTCAKVSIVGAGMQSHSGVASKMFEAMSNNNINIKMISTSEIKISCIIDRADADKAVGAIHDMLFD